MKSNFAKLIVALGLLSVGLSTYAERGTRDITRLEQTYKSDGTLTNAERKDLHQELNQISHLSDRLVSSETGRLKLPASTGAGLPAVLIADGAVPAGSTEVKLTGSLAWTAVSGDTAAHSHILGTDDEAFAAYSIRWWEDSDDPCKFRAYERNLNVSNDVHLPERNFCNGSPGNEKWAERRSADEYITALQICRNDKKDSTKEKIKGLRVWGRTLDKGAVALGLENGPDEDKHSHCKVWRQKVSCAAGQVATKIKVYYETYTVRGWTTDYGFAKGVSLGCRPFARGHPNSAG